ncbi:MAG: hypothetical protein QM687_09775 [Ferruginibacter sp.]
MKAFFFLLALVPAIAFSQNTDAYGKFTKPTGATIRGASVAKGYERWVIVTNLKTGSGNNTSIEFDMPTGTDVADFRNAMGIKEGLSRAEIQVTKPSRDRRAKSYTLILENIVVQECTDDTGAGTSKIKLKAVRIGWIYYGTDRSGNTTVSSKTGWDASTGTAWTNF